VMRLKDSGAYCIRCEECECEWDSPETAKSSSNAVFHKFDTAGCATRDEMRDHPWKEFIKNLQDV
jgi:hypothetical protein